MPQPAGRCIFCNGFRLTKEHLFSDWLREVFPRTPSDTHTVGTTAFNREIASTPIFRRERRQGHSGSKKLRALCKSCNLGWVSKIDEDAKYVGLPIIKGQPTRVTQAMQIVLARWFVKTAMVGDSFIRKRAVVTAEHRRYLMEKNEPPPGYEVWVATYGGSEFRDLAWYLHGGRLDVPSPPAPLPFAGYVESVTLGLGRLLVLILATDIEGAEFSVGLGGSYLRRIWPLSEPFAWPHQPIAMDYEARIIRNTLRTMLQKPLSFAPRAL